MAVEPEPLHVNLDYAEEESQASWLATGPIINVSSSDDDDGGGDIYDQDFDVNWESVGAKILDELHYPGEYRDKINFIKYNL